MTIPQKIDVKAQTDAAKTDWNNWVLAHVNDHVVRVSVMTRDFHWHSHTNSDEVFLVLEGGLLVDFEGETVSLDPGQMIVVPRNVVHRTRPREDRVVTMTFEHSEADVTGG